MKNNKKIGFFDKLFNSQIVCGKRRIWIGIENFGEEHRHDYHWIENKKERAKWIKQHWKIVK